MGPPAGAIVLRFEGGTAQAKDEVLEARSAFGFGSRRTHLAGRPKLMAGGSSAGLYVRAASAMPGRRCVRARCLAGVVDARGWVSARRVRPGRAGPPLAGVSRGRAPSAEEVLDRVNGERNFA